jgi:hypothetical protein
MASVTGNDEHSYVRHVRSKKATLGPKTFGYKLPTHFIIYFAKRAAGGTQLISVDAPEDFSKIPIMPSARHAHVIFSGKIGPWAIHKAAMYRSPAVSLV